MSLPELFDKKGTFLPMSADALAVLNPDERSRYDEVTVAADALNKATAYVKDCADRVEMCGGQVDAARKYLRENFKPPTHDRRRMSYRASSWTTSRISRRRVTRIPHTRSKSATSGLIASDLISFCACATSANS